MPDSPDFEQIALRLAHLAGLTGHGAVTCEIGEQLRLVWNARGAADIAKVELLDEAPASMTTAAIRSLDR